MAVVIDIAGSSTFKGEVNCDGLQVIPQDASYIGTIYLGTTQTSQASNIAKKIYDSMYDDGPSTSYANLYKINGLVFQCSCAYVSPSRDISYLSVVVQMNGTSPYIMVPFYDSAYRTIPATALYGNMEMVGISGNLDQILCLVSTGSRSAIANDDEDNIDGIYYYYSGANPYVNITSDYDNVYLNIPTFTDNSDKSDMRLGQIYADENGFVKIATINDVVQTQNLSLNTLQADAEGVIG